MSLPEILKLVGFATGAVLHLYIAWLIYHRRIGSRQSLTQAERTFIVLGLCVGVWFSGNLFTTLHVLVFGTDRLIGWLRAWDMITMTGVALLPAALLHSHVAFWSWLDDYRVLKPRHVRIAAVVFYLPVIVLPYAAYLIISGDYQPFFVKLRPLLLPYSVWFLSALWSSAAIDWAMKNKLYESAKSERAFFKQLALMLFLTGAFEFIVVGVRRSGPSDYLWVAYILLSLMPTFTVAYYVYRYNLYELVIKGSLVYAAFAVVFITVYLFGVRRLDEFLVARYQIQPGVIEVILILGMVALAGPLVRVMDRTVRRLFTREIGLYRDVVRQVSSGAAGFGDLDSLVRYTEETIRRGLDLERVQILPLGVGDAHGAARHLAEKMKRREAEVIEMDEDLAGLDATIAYALWREDALIGLMLIKAESLTLTSEKRAILDVLAGQVAIEVESCRLVEEKVRLERELANRERLATLGHMAATVAHEVKNPLSSIKSIAQVMREDAALAGFDRDLELIVGEIDRLNRTVSQLLTFSRPSNADPRPAALVELIDATIALLANEAKERGVNVRNLVSSDVMLTGAQAAALREALSNLVINAIQATGRGGEVAIEAGVEANDKKRAPEIKSSYTVTSPPASILVLSVTDDGAGIPREEQQRIFEPFYTTKSRGTGLGLAIVQRRAAELGGSVELISPVAGGHGTRFRLIVPLVPVSQGEAAQAL